MIKSLVFAPVLVSREVLRGIGIGVQMCFPRRHPRPAWVDDPTSGGGCERRLAVAAAIELEEWASHRDCPAPIYCRALARQLRDAADRLQAHK